MCPLMTGEIQTSSQAGGMAKARIRARDFPSRTTVPSGAR